MAAADRSGTRDLVTFFLLTFALSWAAFLAGGAVAGAEIPSPLTQLFFLPGVFAPAVVALWLTAREGGRGAADALFARALAWRVSARWYVFALGYIVLVKLVIALSYRAVDGVWPTFASAPWYLMVLGVLFSTPFQAGEEIGWRGYALPRLAPRFGLGGASVILGVIWALWHLPFFFIPVADSYGQSLSLYVVQVTAISVAMAWLYVKTEGSLLLVMLMHSTANNTQGLIPSPPRPPASILSPDASVQSWLGAAVLWIGAAFLLVRMRRMKAAPGVENVEAVSPSSVANTR